MFFRTVCRHRPPAYHRQGDKKRRIHTERLEALSVIGQCGGDCVLAGRGQRKPIPFPSNSLVRNSPTGAKEKSDIHGGL